MARRKKSKKVPGIDDFFEGIGESVRQQEKVEQPVAATIPTSTVKKATAVPEQSSWSKIVDAVSKVRDTGEQLLSSTLKSGASTLKGMSTMPEEFIGFKKVIDSLPAEKKSGGLWKAPAPREEKEPGLTEAVSGWLNVAADYWKPKNQGVHTAVADIIGTMVPSVAATLITKKPVAGGTTMMVQGFADRVDRLITEHGRDKAIEIAKKMAPVDLAMGSVNAGVLTKGLGKFVKPESVSGAEKLVEEWGKRAAGTNFLGGVKEVSKRGLESAATMVPMNVGATTMEQGLEGKPMTPLKTLSEQGPAAIAGVVMGGLGAAGQIAPRRWVMRSDPSGKVALAEAPADKAPADLVEAKAPGLAEAKPVTFKDEVKALDAKIDQAKQANVTSAELKLAASQEVNPVKRNKLLKEYVALKKAEESNAQIEFEAQHPKPTIIPKGKDREEATPLDVYEEYAPVEPAAKLVEKAQPKPVAPPIPPAKVASPPDVLVEGGVKEPHSAFSIEAEYNRVKKEQAERERILSLPADEFAKQAEQKSGMSPEEYRKVVQDNFESNKLEESRLQEIVGSESHKSASKVKFRDVSDTPPKISPETPQTSRVVGPKVPVEAGTSKPEPAKPRTVEDIKKEIAKAKAIIEENQPAIDHGDHQLAEENDKMRESLIGLNLELETTKSAGIQTAIKVKDKVIPSGKLTKHDSIFETKKIAEGPWSERGFTIDGKFHTRDEFKKVVSDPAHEAHPIYKEWEGMKSKTTEDIHSTDWAVATKRAKKAAIEAESKGFKNAEEMRKVHEENKEAKETEATREEHKNAEGCQ